jgi:hypothetical protein
VAVRKLAEVARSVAQFLASQKNDRRDFNAPSKYKNRSAVPLAHRVLALDGLNHSRRTLLTAGSVLTAFVIYLLCGGTLEDRPNKRDGWGSALGNTGTQKYSAKDSPIRFRVLEGSFGLLALAFFYSAYKMGRDDAPGQ